MDVNPQRRIDDASNLDTDLGAGRTVRQVANERARRAAQAALDEAMSFLDPDEAAVLARQFIAGHGR